MEETTIQVLTNSKQKYFCCDSCGKSFKKSSQLQYHVRRIHENEKEHVCNICSKAFFKKSDLSNHALVHGNTYKCICKTCGRSFKHISNLNRHIRTHTGEKPYLCAVCQKRFSQVAALQQHFQTVQHKVNFESKHDSDTTPKIPGEVKSSTEPANDKGKKWWFYCTVCEARFEFVHLLREHEREHMTFDDILEKHEHCSDPSRLHSSPLKREENSAVLSTSPEQSCEDDNKFDFGTQADSNIIETSGNTVTSVQLTLTENGQILLDNNEVLLTLKDKLYGVVFVNNNVTIVENDAVHRVLNTINQSQKTVTVKTESVESQPDDIGCPLEELDSVHNNLQDIDEIQHNTCHISRTNDVENGLCDLSATLPADNELNEPEKLLVLQWWMLDQKLADDNLAVDQSTKADRESRKIKYTCSECGRIFDKKNNYQQHLGTHFMNEMKHECPICGRRFAWKSTVVKHMARNHGEQRAFECQQCGRYYKSRGSVQLHIRRDHLNIKSHHCSRCGKSFFRKYELRLHFRKHTNERPYICGTCGKTFGHPSHVVRHERLHQKSRPH